jgi:hypothetical protein
MKRVFGRIGRTLKEFNVLPDEGQVYQAAHSQDAYIKRILENTYVSVGLEMEPLVSSMVDRSDMSDIYLKYIQQIAGIHITQITETTLEDIRKLMSNSATSAEFKAQIDKYWRAQQTYRAYVIARTETAAASTATADLTVKTYDTGRRKQKTWNTISDTAVRIAHREMDGVTVPYEMNFEVPYYIRKMGMDIRVGTDRMKYPLDMSSNAHAGNIVNCRCFCTYSYAD